MWNNLVQNLLCAKYDPIHLGTGEVGMNDERVDDNSSCTSSIRGRKRKGAVTTSALELVMY